MNARDQKLWRFVDEVLVHYAGRFNLQLNAVSPMPRRKRKLYDGSCSKRGRIRITLRRRGELLKPWELVDVMAHELAHLPFQNHKTDWFKLYAIILHAMAHEGVFDNVRKLCDLKP